MIISGVTGVMLSLAVRKVADTTSSKLAAQAWQTFDGILGRRGEGIARFGVGTRAETRH
jgi:hypothetical protein